MSETTDPFPDGSKVRVTGASVSGDEDMDPSAGRAGEEYTVFSYAPEGDRHNDDPQGKAYYMLDDRHTIGGSHWAYPEHVEVVMTPEQLAARKLPSAVELRNGVASALMGMYDPVEVDEADYSGESEVMAYGETDDGLRVGFRVRVDQVREVDY